MGEFLDVLPLPIVAQRTMYGKPLAEREPPRL